jgi:serine/threonine protein phosphatase 1
MSRLFAIGDIHGCFDEFREMIEKINPSMDDKLILLGDYIDRGPGIKETIDYILSLKEQGFDIVALKGNHEVLMLHALSTGNYFNWLNNGAESTLASFGIGMHDPLDSRYLDFFKDLLWYYQHDNYLFVHAGFSNSDPFTDYDPMVWTRNERYTHPLLTDKIIIHGHTPITREQCIKNVRRKKNVLNIDTGCVYKELGYGVLTAIELPSQELFFT